MTAVSAVGDGRTWSIGSAIEAAASVLARHFAPFVATALIAALPSLLFGLLVGVGSRGLLTITGIVSMVINLAVLTLVIQTLTYGTVQALRGSKVSIGDCLMQGLRNLPVGMGVGFLAYLGIVLGTILLIVPGLILFTMWSVALPAAIVERTGVFRARGRSRDLTSGRRWRVFGAILIPILISIVTSWILIGLVFGLRGVTSTTFQIVSWLVSSVEQAFSVCVFATLYYYLRRDKEGVDIAQIAAVLD